MLSEGRGKARGEGRIDGELRISVSTSLAPPTPLGPVVVCDKPSIFLQTLHCADSPPLALVSYPPAAASAGCGFGIEIDDRYEIVSMLGQGGMGIVYLARHRLIDKMVAIKVLRRDLAHDESIAQRFLLEAQAASSIGSPHIVDVSDFGRLPDGSTYFVMELLEGAPLSKLVANGKRVPVARILRIGRQIADALFAAHQRGIVHRDLKTDNIFLIQRGTDPDFVKILDFGIAKMMTGPSARQTQVGAVFGTPHYMSPEQAAGATVDCRTDVYALGVILYELASGQVPFEGNSLMEILSQHLYRMPVPLGILMKALDFPAGLEAIIFKALSKKPDQRYSTMHELGEDLDRLANGEAPRALESARARSASVPPAPPARGQATPPVSIGHGKRAPARWGVYAGATAILMACGLTTGVLLLRAENGKARVSNALVGPSPAPPAQLGALPLFSSVLFAAEPLDAHVFRAGVDLGSTPLLLEVQRGQRLIFEVRLAGYVTRVIELDGTEKKKALKLVPVGDLLRRNRMQARPRP